MTLCFPPTQDGTTAIFYAAMNGNSDIVSLLVEAKADINLPDEVIIFSDKSVSPIKFSQ